MTRKKTYKNGMKLFHNVTKVKIMFGKWITEDKATCLEIDKKNIVTLTREDLDTNYISYASLDKAYREKRKYEAW